MAKKITNQVKNFIWQLQKFPMTQEFEWKINSIINSSWDSAHIKQNMLIIKDSFKTYTISIGKDTIEYNIYYTDKDDYDSYTIDEVGKIYKCDKNIITKYLDSTTTTRHNYKETTHKTTISCFNEDLTEIFKSITTNYKNHNKKTGKKENSLITTKIRRTHDGNLIRTDESANYVSSKKIVNSKCYSIRRNKESHIPNIDTAYTPISKDLYIDYMNFRITEDELFKHFVKSRWTSTITG